MTTMNIDGNILNISKPHCIKYVKTNASEPFGTYLVNVAFLH